MGIITFKNNRPNSVITMKRVHLFISGRVQGVFFRANVQKKARKLGIVGFVRNLADSRVEAVCQGEDEKVDELIEYCKEGPSAADVDDVEVKEEEPKDDFDDFEVSF